MFTVLNRLRGMNGVWSKFIGLLLSYILLSISYNQYLALSVGILYVIGESFGIGDCEATLTMRRINKMPTPYTEGKNNGIQWLASHIIDPSRDWINHCRVWLFIRGIYWWICLLPLVFFIEWHLVLISIIILGLAFPLACELGYYTSKLWNFKYMNGGGEHSEVWNGLAQDIVILILLLRF
ncbi:hypothetical protein [Sulfurospirillum sp. UCH001]|uniref:hypothetical protein n=1 Tax=Sulfurospirillum sp. UCH001 TaxID=1581011 RepID=UPI00082A65A2|nr:hypothetical protein [Sulfurospirillum sp. UCH001]